MNSENFKILLIEDDYASTVLMQEILSESREHSFELECFDRLSSGLERLEKGNIDLILLDLGLPDSKGFGTFAKVHSFAPHIPIIILTGLTDEEISIKAVRSGAQDYLVKGNININMMVRTILHSIERDKLQKELEEARSQQLKMKDQFLSMVSHELRTPLSVIHQFVTILLDRIAGDLSVEQNEYLEIVLRNVKQLGSMIEDLLKLTRIKTGGLSVEPMSISVVKLIDETKNMLKINADSQKVIIHTIAPDNLPYAFADPKRVQEILTNLIDNAVKFTPENGEITVTAGIYEKDEKSMLISVSDNGCGISAEDQEKIFEYLSQGNNTPEISRKGLGIGLYICKQLVILHGGQIWVESQEKKGSTFSFTLPIHNP